jgi:isoleucyl-tRNA synthetase
MLSNLSGFNPETDLLDNEQLLSLDRWIIGVAHQLQQEITQAYTAYQFHLVYQKVHNFCVLELGGFYLDIIKDRQYTTQVDSLARRSAQTALYHISEAFVRWIAPVLSYTAEEIWQVLPGKRSESVFLELWYENLAAHDAAGAMGDVYWQQVIAVKTAVNKAIEQQRAAGNVGASLSSDVILYCNDALSQQLQLLGDELRFVLITSSAVLKPLSGAVDAIQTDVEGLQVSIIASPHTKCVRCWHYREDVGANAEHAELCGRCVTNVAGSGEVRLFA